MADRTCSIEDCERKFYGRGWCAMHYQRWLKWGDPESLIIRDRPVCTAEGCDRPNNSHGLCAMHGLRVDRHGTTDPEIKTARGMSVVEALLLYTITAEHPCCWLWDGGAGDGYGKAGVPGRSRRAHVLVWEECNGRRVPAGWDVHHECRNTLCVAPYHLTAMPHGDHSRIHH